MGRPVSAEPVAVGSLFGDTVMTGRLAFGSMDGRELKRDEIAGFSLQEWDYGPDFAFPRHSHDRAFLNLPLHGSYAETYGKRARMGRPFQLVFQPAGEVHAKQFHHAGGRTFDVEIPPAWLERVREYGMLLDQPAEFAGGLPVWLTLRLYREFYRRDEVSPLAMEGLALELLAEIARRPVPLAERRPPRWLRQARELLHAHFAENLALEEIAQRVQIHPDHLARVFRQQYGSTVGDYVRQMRLDFACQQLATSDLPLIEIALAAGFVDQSHLTRTFRCRMGLTPAQFRKKFRACRFDTTE
jgi:AraC family transcriptional regulator